MSADRATKATICSSPNEHKGHPLTAARAMGLDIAAKMLGGNRKLGELLGISDRAVAYKIEGARGISDFDLIRTAKDLDRLAARLAAHAEKLRGQIPGHVPTQTGGPP